MLRCKQRRGKAGNKGMRAAFGVSGAKLETLLGLPTIDDVQRQVRADKIAAAAAENKRIQDAIEARKLREAAEQ